MTESAQQSVYTSQIIGYFDFAQIETKTLVVEGRVFESHMLFVEGWVFDPTQPEEPVKVLLLLNGKIVTSGTANVYRPDLQNAGRGSGRCGFAITYKYLDPLSDPLELKIRVLGSDFELVYDRPLQDRHAEGEAPIKIASSTLSAPVAGIEFPDSAFKSPSSIQQKSLIYFPNYAATNPYQSLLYSELAEHFDVRAVSLEQVLELSFLDPPNTVFHLHWPEALFAGVTGAEQMEIRATDFLSSLQTFRALGGKFVWTIHNLFPHDAGRSSFYSRLQRELVAKADLLHFHSDDAVREFDRNIPLNRARSVKIIPHPSYSGLPSVTKTEEARERLGIPTHSFVVGFIGQLRPYKGLEQLILAHSRLIAEHDHLHLLIAGKPTHPARPGYWVGLQPMTQRLHVYEGFIPEDELQLYFAACDVIALPYRKILTSGSAMLAATFGKPVIMPDLAALRDLSRYGFVKAYDPDDERGLEEAILSLMQNASSRQTMSQAALKYSRDTTPQKTSRLLLRSLDSLFLSRKTIPGTNESRPLQVGNDRPIAPGSIGVAIVNYRTSDRVRSLIETLPNQVDGYPVEVFVFDNSNDEAQWKSLPGGTILLRTEANLGYAGGNNELISVMLRAKCEYCFIVNPDILVSQDALDILLAFARANPQSVLSPLVLKADDTVSFAGGYVEWTDTIKVVHRHDGEPESKVSRVPYQADVLNGCALFFSMSLADKLGPIPEDYFLYYEETDWLLRAAENGVNCIVVPDAKVHHSKISHGTKVPALYYLYYLLRGAQLFHKKLDLNVVKSQVELQANFIEPWEKRLQSTNPGFLPVFRRAVGAALRDGRAQVVGPINLSERLDEIELNEDLEGVGYLESVSEGRLVGWAACRKRNTSDPWRPASVWLIVDDVPICEVPSDTTRPDLDRTVHAGGAGFDIPLPETLLDSGRHIIEVRNCADGKRLAHSVTGQRFLSTTLGTQKKAQPNYSGRLDGIKRGQIEGWAFDSERPDRTVFVDIEIEGEVVQEISAHRYRQDLNEAGKGNGCHSFSVGLPKDFLKRDILKLKLFVAGTGILLSERELPVSLPKTAFSTKFSPEQFFRWAYINDDMPVGRYEESADLREYFDLNKTLLYEEARQVENGTLVSIIMPAFNRQDVIAEAIRSVLSQTHRNWELLIVDDGSTDGTVEAVKELTKLHEDQRLRLLALDTNRGVSAARNIGLEAANGELIAYLDSDNVWYPEYLSIMAHKLCQSEGSLAAYSGQEIWEQLPHFGRSEMRWIRCCPFNRSRLEERNYIDLNVFTHRRELVDQHGGFREDMRRLVDWDLIQRYTAHRPPLFVPALLARYFVGLVDNQITSTVDFLDSYRKLLRGLKRNRGEST